MKSLFAAVFSIFLLSCEQEPTVTPSDERVLYPAECDYSPILYGSIKIYTADTQFMARLDIDYDYTPEGAYYIKLPSDTYHFEVTSDHTRKSSFITLALNSEVRHVDLEACE